MTERTLYPYPAELDSIPLDRSAVVEASAGTGKTFLIEHLVVDRIIRGAARLEDMLVVTFTERAAAELVRRIRKLLGDVLAHPAGETPNGPAWIVEGGPPAPRYGHRKRALGGDLHHPCVSAIGC